MVTPALRHNLLMLLLLVSGITGLMQSCSKGVTPVYKTPFMDTTSLLTGSNWEVSKLWFDMNNNGRIDSGELVNGFDFTTVYIFSPNGTLQDSTVPYLQQTGTWAFQGNTHTAFYCNWPNTTDLYKIVNITDSTLVAKLIGTDQTWYFIKS